MGKLTSAGCYINPGLDEHGKFAMKINFPIRWFPMFLLLGGGCQDYEANI